MNTYFERYASKQKLFDVEPSGDVAIIIVIPCYNEFNLILTLESLHRCKLSNASAEVIIIINEPESSPPDTSKQNQFCFTEASEWIRSHPHESIRFLIDFQCLNIKHAGVGLARKIGMDEAARRFEMLNKPDGVICGFDADCTCSFSYFNAIYQAFFLNHSRINGASIYFEHPLEHEDPLIVEGIIQYELHLRYYINALRYAGYPFAYQTIGSSMAVRSDTYQAKGGMNRRKAAEDFYFLHRIIPAGNFIEINDTVVYPSPRPSDRVPFGTGRAMNTWLASSEQLTTYNIESFHVLKDFLNQIPQLYDIDSNKVIHWLGRFPAILKKFFITNDIEKWHKICIENSSSRNAFIKHWFSFFNGLKVLKFIHFARDNGYDNQAVSDVACQLAKIHFNSSVPTDILELLKFFRQQDRTAGFTGQFTLKTKCELSR